MAGISINDKTQSPSMMESILRRGREASQAGVSVRPTNYSLEEGSSFKSQRLAVFVRDNADLLSVIDRSREAQEILRTKNIASRNDLIQTIAETAHGLLKGEAAKALGVEQLKASPVLASLIVLNAGGARDLLNGNPDLAAAAVQGDVAARQRAFDHLAEKASALFAEDSPLHDADFFKGHVRAAVYVLSRPEVTSTLTNPSDAKANALAFKERIDHEASQAALDANVARFADEAVNSGVYTDDFFSEQLAFADMIAAGEFDEGTPKPSEFLQTHPEYGSENLALNDRLDISGFYRDVFSFQGRNRLDPDSPIMESDLQKEEGLRYLLVARKEFAQSLNTNESKKSLRFLTASFERASLSEGLTTTLKQRFQAAVPEPPRSLSVLA